jgi:replicative DNA helicase
MKTNNNAILAHVPPHATELESAVLGAILLEKSAFEQISGLLKPECFYSEANRKIFSAMEWLANRAQPIDLYTVIEQLRFREELDAVGGPYYVTRLTNDVVSSANIVAHARILYQKHLQRKLIDIAGQSLSQAQADATDAFDLLDKTLTQLGDLNHDIQSKRTVQVVDESIRVVTDLHNRVMLAREGKEDPSAIYTGIRDWDRINGRLFPGLFIVAGRPGMGKGVMLTELVCRMGTNFPIGVVNGEMTNQQLLIRIGCNLKGIDNQLWKKNPEWITDEELQLVYEAMQEAQGLKLHIEDNRYIHTIAAKIRKWVERDGVKCVLIDFLTLLKVHEDMARYLTDTQRLNYILDVLVGLCKELNVPVILFCQLNRDLYKRGGNKEPNLADLKGSGNIEEYAYQISFLHRPEYYDITEDELGESTKGLLYHIIAKHRDGKLDRLKFHFVPQCSQLRDWQVSPINDWSTLTDNPF